MEVAGRTIGRYRLRRRIGLGGMGEVYLADIAGPSGIGKWFAIKLLHAHLQDLDRVVAMFREEARIASRIEHPNVCQILDFARDDDGTLYVVMEHLKGEPLSALLRGPEALPGWAVARIVADAARGLHAAHEARDESGELLGVVHRDVSPQNLFVLYAGPCKVLDFGIARVRTALAQTNETELRGKIAYMSPEQIESPRSVDRRADVWALGVVLWESLAGRRLFAAEGEQDAIMRVLHARLRRPSTLRAEGDAQLDDIALRALRRDRAQRYPTAAALAEALEDWLHRQPARAGYPEVAAWLERGFASAKAQTEQTIAVLASNSDEAGSTGPVSPPAGTDTTTGALQRGSLIEVPTRVIAIAPVTTPTGTRNPASRRRGVYAVLAAIGALAVAIAVLVAMDVGEASGPAPTIDTEQSRPPGTAPGDPARVSPTPPLAVRVVGPAPDATPMVPSTPPSSEPAPPAATEASAPRPGRLNLIALPEAEVYLRGRRLGRTPLVGYALPAGTHRLELRPVDRSAARSVTVRIRAGQTTRIALR